MAARLQGLLGTYLDLNQSRAERAKAEGKGERESGPLGLSPVSVCVCVCVRARVFVSQAKTMLSAIVTICAPSLALTNPAGLGVRRQAGTCFHDQGDQERTYDPVHRSGSTLRARRSEFTRLNVQLDSALRCVQQRFRSGKQPRLHLTRLL